jgi:protein phosphatase PTC1
MFGSSGSPPKEGSSEGGGSDGAKDSSATAGTLESSTPSKTSEDTGAGEKRGGNGSPQGRTAGDSGSGEKKRRSSGVGSKASSLLASAKNSLSFSQNPNSAGFGRGNEPNQTPLQRLGKQDPALSVPQGQHNNSAGESLPTPRSTFRVGVWEDKNKKCRRTMEDTHAFLYNFLHTPAPALGADSSDISQKSQKSTEELAVTDSNTSLAPTPSSTDMMEHLQRIGVARSFI